MSSFDQISEAAEAIRQSAQLRTVPDVAVVLGSGLGGFASSLRSPRTIPYSEIPHWPTSDVVGHEGKLVIGEVASRRVAALSGRVHFYEGYDIRTVTFATADGSLGVKTLILRSGGVINTSFRQGG